MKIHFFHQRQGFFTELLVALNDKGIIIFVQNQQQPQNSWIVVDTEKILKEIDRISWLASKRPLKQEHRQAVGERHCCYGVVASQSSSVIRYWMMFK